MKVVIIYLHRGTESQKDVKLGKFFSVSSGETKTADVLFINYLHKTGCDFTQPLYCYRLSWKNYQNNDWDA